MPTINRRLLLRLFIVVVLLGAGLFALHSVQAERATDALRWQAERAAEMGKPDKAILYLQQYLELRPGDHEAALRFATMILKRGRGQKELASALFLYERVLREAPQLDDVRRKLLDICLLLGRNSDATIHAKALLERSPRDAELWEDLGVSQVAQNKHDEARASYEKAIEYDPDRIRSYELLVDLLLNQLNLPDEAREWIDKMVNANRNSAVAYLVRSRYFRTLKKQVECQRDAEKVLELDPENADGLLILAEVLQGKGEINKSRSALAEGLTLYRKDIRFYRVLSWLELSAGNLAAATACLEQGTLQLPQALELLTPLGDLLIQQGDVERVKEIIKKLEAAKNVGSQISYLRARLLITQNQWAEAAAVLERLRTEAVAMPGLAAQANILLAACHEHLGDPEAQMEALKRVLLIDPGNLGARLQFGSMHLTAGRLDDAIKEYTIATRSPYASVGARIMLGRLLIARARGNNRPADWNYISEYVEAVRTRYKNSIYPVLLAAEMHMARQQPDAARKLLQSEAGRKVNDARIWAVLAAIAQETDGFYAALDVLDDAQRIIGDQVELRLSRARVWANDWHEGREKRIGELARGIEAFSDSEQLHLLGGLVDVCYYCRDLEGLKNFQKQIVARLPSDLASRRELYDSAARTRDRELMAQVQKEIKRIEGPDGTVAAVAEALARVEKLNQRDDLFEKVSTLARNVLASTPDRADARLLSAKLAERAGDLQTALRHYEHALELEPTNLVFLEAHLNLLLRMGDDGPAKQRIEHYFRDPRLAGEAFRALIERVSERADADQFNKMMTWLAPMLKPSGEALLWAARLEQKKGRTARASVILEQALQAAPRLVDAWVARTRIKPEAIPETLKTARKALDDLSFFTLCAELTDIDSGKNFDCTAYIQKPEQARTYAKACMTAFMARGRDAEARTVLKKLGDDANARPLDRDWAKRNLALLTLTRGSVEERQEALASLGTKDSDAATTVEEWRERLLSLTIALRYLHGPERQAAIRQALEASSQIVAATDCTADDWFHRAQFQLMAGDRPQYEQCLREAMQRDQANVFYAVAYVAHLLEEGKLELAEPLVPRLAQATNDLRAITAASQFYALSNAPDRSIEIVDEYIQAGDSGTQDNLVRLRQAANILDQTARLTAAKNLPCAKAMMAAALEKYQLALRSYAESAVPYAELLALDGQMQKALDLLSSKKPDLSTKTVALAGAAVIRNGKASPNQLLVVKGWLDQALEEDPKSVPLRMSLGEFHTNKLEYDAAKPIYREVLRDEPDNTIALNNLAWILSTKAETADEADKCVQRAIELMGPTAELLDTRARIAISRGNIDQAIKDLNEALSQSRTALRYFHLALAQFKVTKTSEALSSFKEARTRGLDANMVHPADMETFKVLAAQMRD